MRYRKKPIIVDAFQMTEKRIHDKSEWPDWLREAESRNTAQLGAVWLAENEFAKPAYLYRVRTRKRLAVMVNINDWIIRESKTNLYVLSPADFKEEYAQA